MAFTPVLNSRHNGGRAALTNKVRIGKGSASNNSVPLSISADLAAASGLTNSHVSIMIGTGDDAGKLLVSPATSGFRIATGKAKSASPRISLPKRLFRETPATAMTVLHEVTPDGLVVRLGRFLKSDQPDASNGVSPTYEVRAA